VAWCRLQREGNAWDGPVQWCLNRIRENENKPWSLNADASQFINEFEENGEIAAFVWLARKEGWKYAAPDGEAYECEELPDLPDDELVSILNFPGSGNIPSRDQ